MTRGIDWIWDTKNSVVVRVGAIVREVKTPDSGEKSTVKISGEGNEMFCTKCFVN